MDSNRNFWSFGIFTSLLLLSLLSFPLYSNQLKMPSMMTHEKTVSPGQKLQGSIPLVNTGDEILRVKIYPVDYLFSADGTNQFLEPGTQSRSNANWLTFTPTYVEIPPHKSAQISYNFQIPEDTSLTGTYWSLLFIEQQGESSKTLQEEDQLAIQTVIRYGFQLITHLENSGKYALKILDKKLLQREGKKVLLVDFENTGTRRLTPQVWVDIFDLQGQAKGHFEGKKMRVYPSCSVRCEIDVTPLPRGSYQALVVFDQGESTVFGAQYTFNNE